MNKQNQAKQAPAQGGLSRRGFLSVAGLAAVAAGASLAGCAPQAAKEENAAVGVPETWDYECDVAVVGSGTVLTGAGKAAAASGNKVIIIEAADQVGGTTATSNGQTWMPLNSTAMADNLDDRDDALAYITATAAGKSTPEYWTRF